MMKTVMVHLLRLTAGVSTGELFVEVTDVLAKLQAVCST